MSQQIMEELNGWRLHLITINCFGVPVPGTRLRLATLGQELNRSGADIVCIQEVQLWRYLPPLRSTLTNFPHLAYEPFLHAPKGGLLTASRWPIEGQQFVLYTHRGRWYTPAVSDWLLHKGILVSHLTMQALPLTVINTHLMANYTADWSPRNDYARQQQAELQQLAEMIRAIDLSRLVIIVGDFNVPNAAWLYDEFVQSIGVLDLLAHDPEPTLRPARYLPAHYIQTLDHVLVRPLPGYTLEASAQVVFKDKVRLADGRLAYLSDHMGITAEITCRRL